jgi:hypothetical protein
MWKACKQMTKSEVMRIKISSENVSEDEIFGHNNV